MVERSGFRVRQISRYLEPPFQQREEWSPGPGKLPGLEYRVPPDYRDTTCWNGPGGSRYLERASVGKRENKTRRAKTQALAILCDRELLQDSAYCQAGAAAAGGGAAAGAAAVGAGAGAAALFSSSFVIIPTSRRVVLNLLHEYCIHSLISSVEQINSEQWAMESALIYVFRT